MSIEENPYQSPEAMAAPAKLPGQGSITQLMLVYLKGASPWLKFVGILGFISAGLMALMGVVYIALPAMMAGLFLDFMGAGAGAALGAAVGGFYLAMGVLIIFPSLFTYRFGERITRYLRSSSEQDLEEAFKNNKSMWKFYGILCIVYLALIPVGLVVAIIVAVVAAF